VCVRVSSIRESKKFTLGFPDILCQIAVFSIELTVENHVIVDGSSLGWTITIIQLWGREKKGPSDGNGVGMFTFGYSGMVEGSCPGFFEGTNWGHACVIFVEHPNELSSSHGNLFLPFYCSPKEYKESLTSSEL
jgi:hypothetical protein